MTLICQTITPLNIKLGICCIGANLFSNLPYIIKSLIYDTKVFKPKLNSFSFLTPSTLFMSFTSSEHLLSSMIVCVKHCLC